LTNAFIRAASSGRSVTHSRRDLGGFEDFHQGIDPDDEGNDQGSFLEPTVYPGLISPLLHKTEVSGMLKHIVIFVFDKHLIFLQGNEQYVQYSCIHVQTPL